MGFLAAAVLTAGAWSAAQEATLNYPLSQDPYIIDPTANWLYEVPANLFVPLVSYDFVEEQVAPAGAESWTVSEDGTVYTFTIQDDWTWSDGTPVTAQDYANSFRRIADPATGAPMSYRIYVIEGAQAVNQGEEADLDAIGVRALDDRTLEITLVGPASWFLSSLASIGHAIPQWTIDEHGDAWTQPGNIVVNGPYNLVELYPEDMSVLRKHDGYFDADSVEIDVVNLYVVREASTALAMYEEGALDTVNVPATDLERVRADPDLSAQYYNGGSNILYYYIFNVLSEPFDDVLVRQAFAAALDRAGIVDNITKGGEIPARTVTPPGSVGHVPNEVGIGIGYDPERARELLTEAGYPGGEGLATVTLAFNANENNSRIAQAVQQMWQRELGATVELQAVEGAAYSEIAAQGAFSVWRMGWGMDYPDANNIHSEMFTSDVGSPAIVKNDEYDQLIRDAATETDQALREEMYARAETILVQEEAGALPVYWSAQNILTKPHLDRILAPTYQPEFWKWSINGD